MGSTYRCPLTCPTNLSLEWGNLLCEVRLIGSQSGWWSYFSFFSSSMTKISWKGIYFSSQFLVTVHHCGNIIAKGAQDGCHITSEKLSGRNACSFSARFPQSQTLWDSLSREWCHPELVDLPKTMNAIRITVHRYEQVSTWSRQSLIEVLSLFSGDSIMCQVEN